MELTLNNIETMDVNDVDMLAREMLAFGLKTAGITDAVVVWPDEQRAYLDTADDTEYEKLAKIVNAGKDDDRNHLNSYLFDKYITFVEEITQTMEKRTICTDGDIVTWRKPDGWYSCTAGTGVEGLYAEFEDQGPFESREEAADAMEVE